MIWDIITVGLFLLLVVIPAVLSLPEIPHLYSEAKKGWNGLLFVPVSVLVLAASGVVSLWLSQQVTILQWGWLGHNIIFGPSGVEGNSASSLSLYTIVVFLFIPLVIFLFNYYEEQPEFRDTWKGVGLWAGLHLIMGIPLFAVIPIFSVGVIYKLVYDRMGQQTAYVTHMFTNYTLISVLVVLLVVG